MIGWFKRQGLLASHAAADMLAREHVEASIDAIVRITLVDRDVPGFLQRQRDYLQRSEIRSRPGFL